MASMNPHSGIGQSDSMQRMVSLRVSLAYTEMTMGANGSVMSRAEKLELRARNGFCKECEGIPVQLFTIKKSRLNPLWVTREPLNVTGECENGVCFVCHPDKDPSRKHKMLYGIRRRREGGHYSAPDHSMSPSPRLLYSSKGANAALQRATIQIGDQPFGSNGYPPITMQPEHDAGVGGSDVLSTTPLAPTLDTNSLLQQEQHHEEVTPIHTRYQPSHEQILPSYQPQSAARMSSPLHLRHQVPWTTRAEQLRLPAEYSTSSHDYRGRMEGGPSAPRSSARFVQQQINEEEFVDAPSRDYLPRQQISEITMDRSTLLVSGGYESSSSNYSMFVADKEARSSAAWSEEVVAPSLSDSSGAEAIPSISESSGAYVVPSMTENSSAFVIPSVSESANAIAPSFSESATALPSTTPPLTSAPRPPPSPPVSQPPTPLSEREVRNVTEGIDSLVRDMGASGSPDFLAEVILGAMREHPTVSAVQTHCLRLVWERSKDNDAVKEAVMKASAPSDITRALSNHSKVASVQEKGFGVIWSLAASAQNRIPLVRAGVCQHVVTGLQHFIATESLVTAAIGAMRALSPEVEARHQFENLEASKIVVEAMVVNRMCAPIQRDSCAFLSNCAVNVEEQLVSVAPVEELDAIVQAIAHHRYDASVLEGACFALKNYTHEAKNCRSLRQCKDVEELLSYVANFVQDPHCSEDAGDIIERMQLSRTMDESFEDQAYMTLLHIMDSQVNYSQSPRTIMDFIRNNDWSPRLVASGLQAFRRIVNEAKSNSQIQIQSLFDNNMHDEIMKYCRKFDRNENVCEESCLLLASLVSFESHQCDLVDAGACHVLLRSLECGKSNEMLVEMALGCLHALCTHIMCRCQILEKMESITGAVTAHATNESIQVTGAALMSILDSQ